MKSYVRSSFSIFSVFAGLALAIALLWLLTGQQPAVRAAELEAVPAPTVATLPALFTHIVDDGWGADVGMASSLVLNAAGNPVISYYGLYHNLKVAVCSNADCSNGNTTVVIVDDYAQVGATSLALNTAGNPVIGYYDYNYNARDLKVAVCGDPACISGNIITTVDESGEVGMFTSMVLDAADKPIFSYYDVTNGDLKVAVCGNPTCTSGNITATVDWIGNVGQYTSIALNDAGNPVISYLDYTNGDLKVAVCGTPTCTSGNTFAIVDDGGDAFVGGSTSLVLNAAGNPVISYDDLTNRNLKLAVCGNSICTSGNITATVDWVGNVGDHLSLALNAAGNPIISYNDSPAFLKVAACGNPTCTSGNITATVDGGGGVYVGQFTSLALDAAGNPVISYYDNTHGDLKLAAAAPTCFAEYTGDATTDFASTDMLAVQNAINAASPGGTVKVAGYCPGVQQLTGAYTQTLWLSKTLTIQGGYTNTAWLDAPDPIVNPTTLDAQGYGRVVYVTADGATLSNLNIVNGSVDGDGAGIYVYTNTTLTVESCSVTGNHAADGWAGGGLYNNGGTLTVTNSTISDNSASAGSGIYNNTGTLTVLDSFILTNTAVMDGGGIYNFEGSVTVAASNFSSNDADVGGGIHNEGTMTVTNSTISDNWADAEGGGVLNAGHIYIGESDITDNNAGWGGGMANYLTATMVIDQSSLSHNTATNDGGALYNRNAVGQMTLVNSTIYSNTADWGGGILTNGTLTVTNSTLSENAATTGAGGLHVNEGPVYLQNTIIANSINGDDCVDNGGTGLVVNESNLVEDSTCSPLYSGDPNLGALGLYGGTTGVLPLLPGSPAIDMGNDAVCSVTPVSSRDQRDIPRPQGTHCDIGAFEWQYTVYLPAVRR